MKIDGVNPGNLLAAATFTPHSLQLPKAWVGHLPFAAWIMREVAPRIFVELGTHSGNSYLALCQAAVEAEISVRCYAVDTWRGDAHSGQYGDEIFTRLNAHHQERYANFSHLMRMTFDEAVSHFQDGSVELMHIDGLHTYESVKHDFETWLPKLAPGAVVMFHDTNVRERDFGVWKLWQELTVRYRNCLEFTHSHGLGVLQLDDAQGHKLLEWLQPGYLCKEELIAYFSNLGGRQLVQFDVVEHKKHITSLEQDLAGSKNQISDLARLAAEREFRITAILESASWRITRPLRNMRQRMRRVVAAIQFSLLAAARYIFQRLPANDGARLRIRTLFFRHFGAVVGRPVLQSARVGGSIGSSSRGSARGDVQGPEVPRNITSYLTAQSDQLPPSSRYPVTRFMFYIWRTRPDLRRVFDLHNPASRAEYCNWFSVHASREYGVQPSAKNSKSARSDLGECDVNAVEVKQLQAPYHGANLIGYAHGEFGMGEVVRTSARSFAAASVPFSVIDYAEVGIHGAADDSIDHWIGEVPMYTANIFHINADILPSLYFRFGSELFERHYNIGYWAWELSNCPPDFDLALNMVDEVWTISEFVYESFVTRSRVPVISMPLAVSIPEFKRAYSKEYFGLSAADFHFLFIFDAASYLDRKNPIATVRAFKAAFPQGDEKVALVLKTMNVRPDDPLWLELTYEVRADARIRIFGKRLKREEVLGLNSVCDAFVSLHRSEGFGLCLAESMLLGKPLIATNYSGSREFAREGTACVVDYELTAVSPDSYPFGEGQYWAEPDIEHAAFLMRKLVRDDVFRRHIATAGQRYVKENFNSEVIGRCYAARLGEISQRRYLKSTPRSGQSESSCPGAAIPDDKIVGFIDSPIAGDEVRSARSGAIDIAGWAVSKVGISRIEIYCDEGFVGEACYGMLRPDVAAMLPEFCDPGRGGFLWKLDATRLAAGAHDLRVSVHSKSGKSLDCKQQFSVVSSNANYEQWVAGNELTAAMRGALNSEITAGNRHMLISIVAMADGGIVKDSLAQTLDSLKRQIYIKWELIIYVGDDAARKAATLIELSATDSRVSVITMEVPTWTGLLSNCRGDYIGVIGIGDILDPRALFAVAKNAGVLSDAGFLYADEDRVEGGNRLEPRFKPAWSPIYLRNYNYIGRPWFASARLLQRVVIAGDECDSASEHALLRSLGTTADRVIHIPMVLCSRAGESSRGCDGAPGRALETSGFRAAAGLQLAIRTNTPAVSVVIPTCLRNIEIIDKCFSSLLMRTDYPDLEVIVVKNNLADAAEGNRYLNRWPYKVLEWDGPFNWSGINNFGARHATGDLLLFMNDDVEALNRDWLANMVALAMQGPVGAVGAKLLYPNGTIQHAGIHLVNYEGYARHLFRCCSGTEAHVASMVRHNRECSSVTGACLLSRRDVYESIQGFDEQFPLVANDVDYCLRLADNGFSSVIAAAATLVHYEGVSRAGMSDTEDIKRFRLRWSARLESGDPFFNPNLDNSRDDWWPDPHSISTLIGRAGSGAMMVPGKSGI